MYNAGLLCTTKLSNYQYAVHVAFRRLECKVLSNQNVRYLYLPSLDLVQRESQGFFGCYLVGKSSQCVAAFICDTV